MCSHIDPYKLLGLTIDSTPADARAAFREMALVLHPDKGGRHADMNVLLDAYRYVLAQLVAVNRTTTVEDLGAAFAAFCEAQQQCPQWGRELLQEVFDADSFNKAFERIEVVDSAGVKSPLMPSMCAKAGYGAMMVQSEYQRLQGVVEPPAYRAVSEEGVVLSSSSSASTTTLLEPIRRAVVPYSGWLPINADAPCMPSDAADFMDAFNTTPEPLAQPPTKAELLGFEEMLKRLVESRDAVDRTFPPLPMNIVF